MGKAGQLVTHCLVSGLAYVIYILGSQGHELTQVLVLVSPQVVEEHLVLQILFVISANMYGAVGQSISY